jgi:putative transcriptional regulator
MSDEMMDTEDFENLIAGLNDVRDYRRGKRDGFVAHVPAQVNVRSIRALTKQTQEGFARMYGFSVAAVRDWEQGRRQPERAARILLAMIENEPETVKRVLGRI